MVLNFIRQLFNKQHICAGCEARDYHIASLKEELRTRAEWLRNELRVQHDDMHDIVRHITGMNRVNPPPGNNEIHSIPRKTGGIQERIRRAEESERAPELVAQRANAYNNRIATLERPEIEVQK